jgi:hypothetical protein
MLAEWNLESTMYPVEESVDIARQSASAHAD